MMSGGAPAIGGYTYQKDYAAFRILSSEALRLLEDGAHSECVESFCIEGTTANDGTVWDVTWKLANGNVQLRECKDAEISKLDRRIFYQRVRRTIADGIEPACLTIGWVTDPDKQSGILKHWEAMRASAMVVCDADPTTAPTKVDSGKTSLNEALYYLCTELESESGAPPIPSDKARDLLARLCVDSYRADELAQSVGDLASSLFELGVGSKIRELIQGVFDAVIQKRHEARYTREEFLQSISTGRLALSLSGTLRTILRFHSAAHGLPKITGIVWTQLTGSPNRTTFWPLCERIPGFDYDQSRVIVASTGVGKTTSTQQAFCHEAGRRSPLHVLRLEAGEMPADTVAVLPMLCLLLSGVSSTWLCIDGLDQLARPDFTVWKQTLSRLQTIPQLTMLLTIRAEVVGNVEWMQRLITEMGEVELGPLSDQQIDAAFSEVKLPAPSNRSLRSCLKNTFLFSVYARTIEQDAMPLADSGEIEAFSLIGAFWESRVVTESCGLRSTGDPNSTHVSKRAAVSYLVERTLAGDDVIRIDFSQGNVANGIEMLCNEGVLDRHNSTDTVRWSHAWFREYAIVDHLRGAVPASSPLKLAKTICDISIDHVARDAANGGCKWFIANSASGAVEEYLETLYQVRKELAREILFDLIDGAARHLTLSKLSPNLLIEAIELAVQKQAWHWCEEIVNLPDSFFSLPTGPELQRVVIEFETKAPSNA